MTKTAAPKTTTPAKAKKAAPELESAAKPKGATTAKKNLAETKPRSAAKTPAISSNAGAATASATMTPLVADVLAAMADGAVAEVAALAKRLDVGTKQVRGAIDALRRRGHHVVRRGKCQFGLDSRQGGAK